MSNLTRATNYSLQPVLLQQAFLTKMATELKQSQPLFNLQLKNEKILVIK